MGALVLLALAALLMAQLGLPRYWALILVWGLLIAVLILQLAKTGLSPLRKVFPTSTLLIALVPFATLALVAVIWPGMAFAWVMIGDGHPEFNLMTLYRELPAGDFFPRHYPFATTGHLLVADSLNITSSYTGIDAFRTDLQAMAAVTFLPIVLAVQQMQMAFGSRLQSGRSMLQGMALGIFACSGLVMGLPASNGFISTSFSVLFYSSLAVLVSALFKKFTVAALLGSALLIIVIVSTWQPVAMTGLGLIIAALAYRAIRTRKSPATIAALAEAGVLTTFGLYELFSIVTSGVSGFPGLHGNYYYPMTPLAIFLLMAIVAITSAKTNRLRTTAIALSAAAIAGTLAFMIGNRFFDSFEVLAGTFIVSSTPYYYLFKYIWLVSVPVVILAGVAITNTLTTSQRRPSAALLTSAFLVVPFIAVTTPNFPWIPKSSQPIIKALSEEFGTELESRSATFYFNVQGDVLDEAISNWWLLQHRRYELGIGGPEWVAARRPHGTAYPQWKEVREELGSASSSGKVMLCDDVAFITSGMNVQDPVNFPDGLLERCTRN